MLKTTRKMPSFEGVAAGQTATLRMPIGRTYEQLLITYSGATLAQLNELRIIANGEVIHRVTELSKLDSMNKFEGRAAAGGVIVFDFNRYGLKTRAGVEYTALGTGIAPKSAANPDGDPNAITTLTAEIDVDAAATSPALSAKAIQSAPSKSGFILKTKQYTYTAGASGEFEIADLPKGDAINKIYVGNHTANAYTKIVIERDILSYLSVALQKTKLSKPTVCVPHKLIMWCMTRQKLATVLKHWQRAAYRICVSA